LRGKSALSKQDFMGSLDELVLEEKTALCYLQSVIFSLLIEKSFDMIAPP
jgi:hypothetical protein